MITTLLYLLSAMIVIGLAEALHRRFSGTTGIIVRVALTFAATVSILLLVIPEGMSEFLLAHRLLLTFVAVSTSLMAAAWVKFDLMKSDPMQRDSFVGQVIEKGSLAALIVGDGIIVSLVVRAIVEMRLHAGPETYERIAFGAIGWLLWFTIGFGALFHIAAVTKSRLHIRFACASLAALAVLFVPVIGYGFLWAIVPHR